MTPVDKNFSNSHCHLNVVSCAIKFVKMLMMESIFSSVSLCKSEKTPGNNKITLNADPNICACYKHNWKVTCPDYF